MRRLMLAVVGILIFSVTAGAQEIGPEAPILGKGTLGLNGLAILEVALPTEYSYNPAAIPLALKMFKENGYAEVDYGTLNFSQGPKVVNTWQLMAWRLKDNSALRLARYSVSSNRRPIAFLGEGPQVEFKGETYEVCYGRLLSQKASVGIAIVPYESIRTNLSAQGVALGSGEAKSDFHARIGGLYLISPKLSVGAVYTLDKIDARTRLDPALTGFPEVVILSGDYRETLWTTGFGYQPREGTILFFAWQKGKISGQNLSETIDLKVYGIHQYLNPRLAVRIGIYDKVPGYEVTYSSRGWTFGGAFSKNTYRRTEQYLGRADTVYLWAGKSW